LISEQKNGLKAELAVAEVEKIFKRRSEKVQNHCIVVALCSEPPHKWNADTASKGLVHFGFIFELGMFGLDGLELDGDFLARDDIDSKVNVTLNDPRSDKKKG